MKNQAALRPFLSHSWRVVEHVEAWHLLEGLGVECGTELATYATSYQQLE